MVNKVLAVKTDEGIDMLLDAERKAWDGNMLCGQEGDADSVLLRDRTMKNLENQKEVSVGVGGKRGSGDSTEE